MNIEQKVEWELASETKKKKPVPVPFRPPQILQDLWYQSQAAALVTRGLTAWVDMQFTIAKLCIWQKITKGS
jgi:hypothetical protein